VLAIVDGSLAYLPGGVQEYLGLRAQRAAGQAAPRRAERVPSGAVSATAEASAPADVSAARQRAGQKELTRLERQIGRLTQAEADLSQELADRASDYTALLELGERLREVQKERASLEDRWLAVAEEIGG
jgi:ABC transport system ATP-binding/permease protein